MCPSPLGPPLQRNQLPQPRMQDPVGERLGVKDGVGVGLTVAVALGVGVLVGVSKTPLNSGPRCNPAAV